MGGIPVFLNILCLRVARLFVKSMFTTIFRSPFSTLISTGLFVASIGGAKILSADWEAVAVKMI